MTSQEKDTEAFDESAADSSPVLTSVQDPELDYSPEDLKHSEYEILTRLNAVSHCTPVLNIISTIPYTNATVFLLCRQSMEHEKAIREVLRDDKRYSVETRPITVDKVREDASTNPGGGGLSSVMSCLPVTCTTLAIRRRAFKRLPRPPFRTFVYRTVLTVFLAVIIASIYNVVVG